MVSGLKYSSFAATILMGVSGCGGPGGAPAPAPTPPPAVVPQYELLSSTVAEASTLRGAAVRSNGASGALETVWINGTLRHDSRAISVRDNRYTITDPNGIDPATGLATDGAGGTLVVNAAQGVQGSYGYVYPYSSTYTVGGVQYDSVGVTGIATSPADLPSTGSVVYNGAAVGTVVVGSSAISLKNGTSAVTANFGAGTVNVRLNGFSATDGTGASVNAPLDRIDVTGATISGSGYSGGAVTLRKGGSLVDVTGANTTTDARGVFYGYDTGISASDEVGGNLLTQGDSGLVTGSYIAD